MQFDHALRGLVDAVEALSTELSQSDRIVGITDELARAIESDAASLPQVHRRFSRLSAGEPYRQKCAFIHQRLVNTRRRVAEGGARQPGVDYGAADELLAELAVMDRSLRRHNGELMARGSLSRLIRRVASFGFHLATMDIREHATKHHEVLAVLYNRIGETDGYRALGRSERTEVLARELDEPRPLGYGHDPAPGRPVGDTRHLPRDPEITR